MSKCKHCGAEIIWITTVAGKHMPCDAEPVTFREKLGAKDKIVTNNGEVLSCEYLQGDEIGYIPHFGSCLGYSKKGKRL